MTDPSRGMRRRGRTSARRERRAVRTPAEKSHKSGFMHARSAPRHVKRRTASARRVFVAGASGTNCKTESESDLATSGTREHRSAANGRTSESAALFVRTYHHHHHREGSGEGGRSREEEGKLPPLGSFAASESRETPLPPPFVRASRNTNLCNDIIARHFPRNSHVAIVPRSRIKF